MADKLPRLTKIRLKNGRELVVFEDDGDTLRVVDLLRDESLRIDRHDIAAVLSPGLPTEGK